MQSRPIGNGALTARLPREVVALMDALRLQGACTDALSELNKVDWENLLEFSDRAHLTLALAQMLTSDFPAWVIDRLRRNVADNAARFERIKTTYQEASSALQQAGVPHLVVKGFAQAPDYVTDPRFRMQGDIDLYCPREHIAGAVAALQSIGYSPDEQIDNRFADHAPSMSRPSQWTWRGNLFDPELPLGFDIHFCLWNEPVNLVSAPGVDQFWERRVVRPNGNLTFSSLNQVDHLAYLALHILRGVLSGQGVVHHVLELATFLDHHADDDRFWREWETTCPLPLRELQAISFSLANLWFACRCSRAVQAHTDALPPMQKLWLQRFGASPLEAMFRRTKDGRLLQVLLADSWAARRRSVWKACIPPFFEGPRSPSVRCWKQKRGRWSLFSHYPAYVCDRIAVNVAAAAAFLVRGLKMYCSQWTQQQTLARVVEHKRRREIPETVST